MVGAFWSESKLITKFLVAMVSLIESGVWIRAPKIPKSFKMGDVRPLLWVYKGLLAIVRKGCANFRKPKSIICDR